MISSEEQARSLVATLGRMDKREGMGEDVQKEAERRGMEKQVEREGRREGGREGGREEGRERGMIEGRGEEEREEAESRGGSKQVRSFLEVSVSHFSPSSSSNSLTVCPLESSKMRANRSCKTSERFSS